MALDRHLPTNHETTKLKSKFKEKKMNKLLEFKKRSRISSTTHASSLRAIKYRSKGVVFLELIIIVPVIFGLTLVVVELGNLFLAYLSLGRVTFEAGRHGAIINGLEEGALDSTKNGHTSIVNRARQMLIDTKLAPEDADTTGYWSATDPPNAKFYTFLVTCPDPDDLVPEQLVGTQNTILVTVQAKYTPIVPSLYPPLMLSSTMVVPFLYGQPCPTPGTVSP